MLVRAGEEVTSISHKYALIKSGVGGRDVVYGLKIETSAARSVCYPYISERVSDVEILRNRMEKGSVCEEHIEDIVKDYITELYIKKLCINGLG